MPRGGDSPAALLSCLFQRNAGQARAPNRVAVLLVVPRRRRPAGGVGDDAGGRQFRSGAAVRAGAAPCRPGGGGVSRVRALPREPIGPVAAGAPGRHRRRGGRRRSRATRAGRGDARLRHPRRAPQPHDRSSARRAGSARALGEARQHRPAGGRDRPRGGNPAGRDRDLRGGAATSRCRPGGGHRRDPRARAPRPHRTRAARLRATPGRGARAARCWRRGAGRLWAARGPGRPKSGASETRDRSRRAAHARPGSSAGAGGRQPGSECPGRGTERHGRTGREGVGLRITAPGAQALERPRAGQLPPRSGEPPCADRLRGRPAGCARVRRRLRAGRAAPRPGEDLRSVLHHQGAGPGHRARPRHRRPRRARHGGRRLGRHRSRGRGGVQDVLPGGGSVSRVLIVDDEPGLRQSLGLLLADAGYEVAAEGNGARALDRARAESFDVVLCDVRMPAMDGLAFLRAYKGSGGTGLVIMMSAYGGEEAALAAMKEGAYDYVPKPFRPDEVVLTLRKAEERERLTHTIATLRAQLDSSPGTRALIAESPAMRQALEIVARVAGHPTTVLITGERGTGKEVIAQAIHRASPRAAGPFVAVNCAAIPDTLLESELFGYVKGAFTGAAGDRPGLFEQADGGTLLLDEVGELPLALQAKLLRVLQENEIRRVGDQKTRRVDVRLLAATAKDLAAEAVAGRFRHDLFDRLNVVAIHLRPLSGGRATRAALGAAPANRREAAKRLGVSLRTLFYKMDRYGMD